MNKEYSEIYRPEDISLSHAQIKQRRRLRLIASRFFRTRVASGWENLEEAAEFTKREGAGMSIQIIHFSRTDPLQAMFAATTHPVFADSRIVAPIAAHQTLPERLRFVERSKSCGVELFPIVTKNTIERARARGKAEGLSVGQGSKEYLRRAAEILKHGGLNISAPQGERQAYLEPFDGRPFATFVQMMQRKQVENFGVLFVGFELEGVGDYQKVKDFNLCRQYSVNFGKFYTRDAMLKEVDGKITDLDLWAWDQLASVSSPAYLRKRDLKS